MIAHIDMDCFFVACEVLRNSSLKGKPVCVGATGTKGVLSTASYEARKFGLRSAMPVSRARELCPHAIFLPGDMYFYKSKSREVMEVIAGLGCEYAQVSVDEAYVDVAALMDNFSSSSRLCLFIQQSILKATGLTCSIGLAECRKVAKIASDQRKPFGITIVRDAKSFLGPLPIGVIPGIGKKSKPFFLKHGIKNISDLLDASSSYLKATFGDSIESHVRLAQGLTCHRLPQSKARKSMSCERTFMHNCSDRVVLKERYDSLVDRLYGQLKGRRIKGVSIKVRLSDFSTFTRDVACSVNDQDSFIQAFDHLFEQVPEDPIRLIGVKVYGLGVEQSSLLEFGKVLNKAAEFHS